MTQKQNLSKKILNNKKSYAIGMFFLLFFTLIFTSSTIAAPDNELTYHGKLTDTSNTSVPDGNYDFKLSIYTVSSGGTPIWTARGTTGTPTAKALTVTNGIFSTVLGESGDNSLDGITFDSNYYLGITIGINSEMTPRRKITPTGFALNSNRLNGLTADNYIDTSATNQTKLGGLTLGDDFTVNTNDFHVDTTAGRVGIGTTSPNAILDVKGNTALNVPSDFWASSADNYYGFHTPYGYLGSNGAYAVSLFSNGYRNSSGGFTSLGIDGNRTASGIELQPTGGIQFRTGTPSGTTVPERMRIDSTGNVGIGTASPGSKLDVAGNIAITGQSTEAANFEVGKGRMGDGYAFIDLVGDTIYTDYGLRLIRGSSGANASSYLDHRGTGILGLRTNEAAPIVFSTFSSERMRVDSNGDVGIGTTNPGSKLEVRGGGIRTSREDNQYLEISNTDAVGGYIRNRSSENNKKPLYLDNVHSGGGAPAGNLNILFRVGDEASPTEIARFSDSGSFGIGMTPVYRLDVAGNIRTSNQFISTVAAGTSPLSVTSTTVNTNLNADLLDGLHAGAFATAVHSHTFNSLTSKTSGTGDYSTNADFVSGRGSGGVALTINDGYGNANVTWNHQGGVPEQDGNAARIEVNTDGTTTATMDFELGSNVTSGAATSLASIMRLQSDGRVGIGDISPNALLTVGNGDLFQVNTSGQITAPIDETINGIDINSGAISDVTTLNTGQGAYELYAMDQDVLTTSSPNFNNLDINSGDDYGIRFWNGSTAYTITMGDDQPNHGTVTDYSMHFNMGSTAGRGFTWGNADTAVSASLNALTGDFTTNGSISAVTNETINGIDINAGAISDTTMISINDNAAVPDISVNADKEKLIELVNGNGGLWQVSGRGGLMLSSADDALILANGDVGRSFDTSVDPDNEIMYLLSDNSVVIKTDLQEGFGTEHNFIFSNTGSLTAPTLNTGHGNKELGDASITNGDTDSIPTNDQVYDFVIGQGYSTTTGDITGVNANTGLIGGGTSGTVSLGIDTATWDDITTRAPSSTGYGSGFYQTSTATTAEGWPENDGGWYHLINSQHNNAGNNFAMQFAGDFGDQDLFYRSTSDNGSQAWNKVWHAGSDGIGSGLNADFLDGISSSSFIQSGQNLNFDIASNTNNSGYQYAAIEVRELNHGSAQTGAASEAPRISFHWGSRVASQIGMGTDGTIRTYDNPGTGYEDFKALTLQSSVGTGTAPLTVASATKVTNLNADLLDDQEGSYYLDNTDTQNLGVSGNTITLTNGGSITAPYATIAGDLSCTDCIGTTEIADSYVLNGGDTMTGPLYINNNLTVGVNGLGKNIYFNNGNGNVSNGSDILIDEQGLIAAESNMFLNIDSDNNASDSAFIFGINTETNSASELMRIKENGTVGIGTSDPSMLLEINSGFNNFMEFEKTGTGARRWRVQITNNGYFQFNEAINGDRFEVRPDGNYWFAGSNISTKESKNNIEDFTESGLNLIKDINVVTYKYNQDDENREKRIGFIANDPDHVYDDRLTNNKTGFDTPSIAATLIKATQEQNQLIITNSNDITTKATATSVSELQGLVDTQFADTNGILNQVQDDMVQAQSNILTIQENANILATQTIVDIEKDMLDLQASLSILTSIDIRTLTLNVDKLMFVSSEGILQQSQMIEDENGEMVEQIENMTELTLGGLLNVKKIVADEIEVNKVGLRNDGEYQVAGTANVCISGNVYDFKNEKCIEDISGDGQTIFIDVDTITENSHVFVTTYGSANQSLSVESIESGIGFTVRANDMVDENMKFDWMIVEW